MKYGDRLRLAREHKGLSQDELVKISGVKQGTVSKIERGDQKSSGFDAELSDALDIHAMWLKKGDTRYTPVWLGGNYINTSVKEKLLPLYGQPDKTNKPEVVMIPLIAFDRAGEWQDALKDHHQDDGEIMLKPITGKDLFIVPVPDDSMEPEFMGTGDEGVVIDPHMEAQHKRFVLVQIGDSITLRQLWNDQGEWLLRPLNTNDFKAKPLGNGKIIGVVRRKVKVKETDYC